jgi:acetolactate synthase-1/3 small subunit
MVPVHKVTDLTVLGDHVERELALVKVAGTGDAASRRCVWPKCSAPTWSIPPSSFVFEVTGASSKIDRFVELMREIGLVEVGRTGIVAMARGQRGGLN